MAYSEKDKQKIVNSICKSMEGGNSLRTALGEQSLSSSTFYEWIDADPLKAKQYARACDDRADKLADEILEIADDGSRDDKTMKDRSGNDYTVEDTEWVNRSKLKVDARKWLLSKLAPKKYGEKIDVTTDGKPIDNKFEYTVVTKKDNV